MAERWTAKIGRITGYRERLGQLFLMALDKCIVVSSPAGRGECRERFSHSGKAERYADSEEFSEVRFALWRRWRLLHSYPHRPRKSHYLQALSELRTARDYIQFDHRKDSDHSAMKRWTRSTGARRDQTCSWDDGKNPVRAPRRAYHPWAPMHEAINSLDSAYAHVKARGRPAGERWVRDQPQAYMWQHIRSLKAFENAGSLAVST